MKKKDTAEKIAGRKAMEETIPMGKTHIGFNDAEGCFHAIPISNIEMYQSRDGDFLCNGNRISEATFLVIITLLGYK